MALPLRRTTGTSPSGSTARSSTRPSTGDARGRHPVLRQRHAGCDADYDYASRPKAVKDAVRVGRADREDRQAADHPARHPRHPAADRHRLRRLRPAGRPGRGGRAGTATTGSRTATTSTASTTPTPTGSGRCCPAPATAFDRAHRAGWSGGCGRRGTGSTRGPPAATWSTPAPSSEGRRSRAGCFRGHPRRAGVGDRPGQRRTGRRRLDHLVHDADLHGPVNATGDALVLLGQLSLDLSPEVGGYLGSRRRCRIRTAATAPITATSRPARRTPWWRRASGRSSRCRRRRMPCG